MRLASRIAADGHAGVTEARCRGGAGPQPNAALGARRVVDRKRGFVVNAGGHARTTHVDPQHVPLVAVRPDQLLAQVAPLAVYGAVQALDVVQGTLLDQVEVLVIAN